MSGYAIIIEGDDAAGYSAYAPELPGVVAAAASYSEAVDLMRDAIAFHLEGLRESGDSVPTPTAVGAEIASCGAR